MPNKDFWKGQTAGAHLYAPAQYAPLKKGRQTRNTALVRAWPDGPGFAAGGKRGGRYMKRFLWTMKDELGLHARTAGELVKLVNGFSSRVTLEKAGKEADASRLFAVMALCVRQDETVAVTVEGPDEEEACEALQKFCGNGVSL